MSKKINEEIIEEIQKENSKTLDIYKTNITLLDCAMGGVLFGKVLNIVGDKSSGKTLLAIEIIYNLKKQFKNKLKVFYDDCESGFSFNEEELYGMKILEDNQKNSETIEGFMYNLNNKLEGLKKDEKLIYVVDSLDGLSSEAEIERMNEEFKARDKGKVLNKGTYGMEKQKKLSEIFRLLNQKIKDKNCLLIVISQVRSNIGVMFGEKYTRSGGKALDFYASQIIWLNESDKLKKKDTVIGIRIKIRCKKNKIAPPFRQCFLDILFDFGVDDITSNINYLYDLLTPTGKYSAKKIFFNEKEYTPAGLLKHIEEKDLEATLKAMVTEKWMDLEDSISSKGRKKKW